MFIIHSQKVRGKKAGSSKQPTVFFYHEVKTIEMKGTIAPRYAEHERCIVRITHGNP